jgi:hypothetical protein
MHGAAAVGQVESLFALTRLTKLDGPYVFIDLDGEGSDAEGGSSSSRALGVPQQWRDGMQHLHWSDYRSSSAMLSQLTNLTFLQLYDVVVTPDLCRCGWEH